MAARINITAPMTWGTALRSDADPGFGDEPGSQAPAHRTEAEPGRGLAISLADIAIDIPDTGPPAAAPGWSGIDAIGRWPATPGPGAASVQAPARQAVDTPVAFDTTLPPAPQVLASGTWLANPQVTLKTSLGDIVVDLYPNDAPVTAANWLAHVNTGFFDDLLFHRVVAGFVVQGGGFTTGLAPRVPPYAPIVLESNNGLDNDRGTLAMARTSAANSATAQFFINLVDNDDLNYVSSSSPGYAVFGKVVSGLSVVDAIGAVPTNNLPGFSNVPVNEVKILEADQTRPGTLHSTTGRVDLGILAADAVWTGQPEMRWQYSLDGGAHWMAGAGRNFTVPLGAYEAGVIQLRYLDGQGNPGSSNGTGGNMVVDARAIVAGDGGANALTGSSAADNLYGLGGNDTLDGGSGADSMTGGSGNDSYKVQNSGDKVIEASGGGTDSVSSSITFTLPGYVEKLVLTGSSALNGSGNGSNNTITGNTAVNSLAGADGNDSLYGMEGVDTLAGGNGNDMLDGGTSGDSMTGGAGNDSYVVQNAADKVIESSGGGTDSVSSSVDHTLAAEVEKLTLTGSAALEGHGNALNNTIVGNSGDNLLRGSTGNDTLTGGGGIDTYRFSSAMNASTNVDTVTDFSLADDVLQLENTIFTQLAGTGVLSSSNFRASTSGSAGDSNDYVLYETDTGKLFYDADGSGVGVAVLFATLTDAPALTSADIFVT